MAIMETVSDGYTMTKKSWFTQMVYMIVYMFIFTLILVPFAFLVAISSVLRTGSTDNTLVLQINSLSALIDDIIAQPFFWLTIYLLLLVFTILASILVGMVQIIGLQKFKNQPLSLEDNIKFPFHTKRLLPFIVLGFLESIVMVIIALITSEIRIFLDLNSVQAPNSFNDFINLTFTWQNITYTIISAIIFLIVVPPFVISCLAVTEDQATYDAFFVGWSKYVKSIIYFEGVTIISAIPLVVVGLIMGIIGIGITNVTGWQTNTTNPVNLNATEFSIVLGSAFVITLLAFFLFIFLLPFFLNTMGKSYEDQKA